jgi:hypothetical protein
MHMILAHGTTDNLDIVLLTDLADNLAGAITHLFRQNLIAIFCNPDQVDLQIMHCM